MPSDWEVSGTLITRVDCPACEEVFDVEGDASGDTVTCDCCFVEIHIQEVK